MIDMFILFALPLPLGLVVLMMVLVAAALEAMTPFMQRRAWVLWSAALGCGVALVYVGIWIEVMRGR